MFDLLLYNYIQSKTNLLSQKIQTQRLSKKKPKEREVSYLDSSKNYMHKKLHFERKN
jgi:hypothetical protein